MKIVCQCAAIVFNLRTCQMMEKLLVLPAILRRLRGSCIASAEIRHYRKPSSQLEKADTDLESVRNCHWVGQTTLNPSRCHVYHVYRSRCFGNTHWTFPSDDDRQNIDKVLNCGRIIVSARRT